MHASYAALCRAVKKAGIKLVDRQLACMPIQSPEGQDYLKAMAAAANFAFCNRHAQTEAAAISLALSLRLLTALPAAC